MYASMTEQSPKMNDKSPYSFSYNVEQQSNSNAVISMQRRKEQQQR